MPSSRPEAIPAVVSLIRRMDPASILDVGAGFGKWGVLFREYTDIVKSELDPPRYARSNWQVRIEGAKGYPDYTTPLHEFVYDRIHLGDAPEVIRGLGEYDVVFAGDIIEHFEKEKGAEFMTEARRHARKCLILTTPAQQTNQGTIRGNELERHGSLWLKKDFASLGPVKVFSIPGDLLLAVYPKPGQPAPVPSTARPARSLPVRIAARLWRPVRSTVHTTG